MIKVKVTRIIKTMFIFIVLQGCAPKKDENIQYKDFKEVEVKAKGTSVTLYGWGGDKKVNRYFDEILAPALMTKYNIKLNRVPMLPNEYLNKISTEIMTKSDGNADIVWINGINFKTAKDNNLLYGPIKTLENYKYLNFDDSAITFDFGEPVNQMEVPIGRAQFIMFSHDNYNITTAQQLFEYAKQHPGKFTYPNPNDFTGAAFVKNLIYALKIDTSSLSHNKRELKKQLEPLFSYLNEIKPYLWNKGETYPANISALDQLFSNNAVSFSMNYNPFHVYANVNSGVFPKTTHTFIFDTGSIANTHFFAIPKNAPNVAGAMVVINEMLSPDMQFKKYQPANWGDLSVINLDKLDDVKKDLFLKIDFGKNSLDIEELAKKSVPELNAQLSTLILELWNEEVLYRDNNEKG